jgi:hypothetical protein
MSEVGDRLATALHALLTPGVKLEWLPDVPYYWMDSGSTGRIVRRLNGAISYGYVVDGQFQESPWTLGEEVLTSYGEGSVIEADGHYAIVELSAGGYFLLYCSEDVEYGYCHGGVSEDEDESFTQTLAEAQALLRQAKVVTP